MFRDKEFKILRTGLRFISISHFLNDKAFKDNTEDTVLTLQYKF